MLLKFFDKKTHKKFIQIIVVAITVASLIIVGLVAGWLVLFHRKEVLVISRGAVVSNAPKCAEIGTSIMEKGGTAVDSAIAMLFCEGVSMPSTMGVGGGFLMTIYNKSTGQTFSLNARETAPSGATQDMFQGNPNLSASGGLSVAIPGELKGYWEAYQRFGGGVSWKDLIQPTIDMCKNGIYVSPFVEKITRKYKEDLYADPIMREIFLDPKTNDTYLTGQHMKRLRLAKTLEIIATDGVDALYNGTLTEEFVKDIQEQGGIITAEDLHNYRVDWQTPIKVTLPGNMSLYSAPSPGSGAILAFILNILEEFLDTTSHMDVKNVQRIIESFKFGYAQRTEMADMNFENITELVDNLLSKEYAKAVRMIISDNSTSQNISFYGADSKSPEDHGTANINVLAPSGDAVSVTSTINYIFGAKFASKSTGIILNDEMDDFSSPNITNIFGISPSPKNFIRPGKRPVSSMCPTIILDQNNNVAMIVGGAGGSRITSSVAQVIINHLWFKMDLTSAMGAKRLHHQLLPMEVGLETEFMTEDTHIPEGLAKIGHKVTYAAADGFAALTAISSNSRGSKTAVFDRRRQGSVSYVT